MYDIFLCITMFTGETLVSIEEGLGPIEDIQVGDYVWSEDIETGEQSLKKVLNVIVSETDVVVYIVTEENEITTTQNHPFYVEGKGWTPASELEEGDVLHTKEGVATVVQSIEVEQLDEAVKVYNLEVEDGHTYYVTDERVLVHNDCGNKGGTKTGGAYKDVPADGGQVHHMPADSVSPYSKNVGPGIRLETKEHMDTASWGRSKAAQAYRAIQKELIDSGLFREAQQMDIDDVRAKFGNKYDKSIQEMLEYTIELLNQ